jgi:hypothetical protein
MHNRLKRTTVGKSQLYFNTQTDCLNSLLTDRLTNYHLCSCGLLKRIDKHQTSPFATPYLDIYRIIAATRAANESPAPAFRVAALAVCTAGADDFGAGGAGGAADGAGAADDGAGGGAGADDAGTTVLVLVLPTCAVLVAMTLEPGAGADDFGAGGGGGGAALLGAGGGGGGGGGGGVPVGAWI